MKKLLKSKFIANVLVLVSGTAGAQLIALVSSPIITRLYGPEAYGVNGAFMSFAQIFIPVIALTYPIAIVLPKKDKDALKIAKFSFFLVTIFSLLFFLILLLFSNFISQYIIKEDIGMIVLFIPIVLFFSGVTQIVSQWLIRNEYFNITSKASILQSLTTNSGKIVGGLFYPVSFTLILFSVLNSFIKLIFIFIFMKKNRSKVDVNLRKLSYSKKELWSKYKDFPLFRTPSTFIKSLSQGLAPILLLSFYGPAAAGFYTLGNIVMQQPIKLIADSVGNVFYPKVAKSVNEGRNISSYITKATIILALIGAVPFILLILFGPSLFSLIFGDQWYKSGVYVQWLIPYLFLEFINRPALRSISVLNAERIYLFFVVIMGVLRILSLFIGYYLYDSDVVSIGLYSIVSASLYILLIIFIVKKSKDYA